MQKKVQCPKCQQIMTVEGFPGETKTVTCPSCNIQGNVIFNKLLEDDNSAISVVDLRKEYGDLVAVNNISFSVKKGEIFAFLGPNGAGKTTTVEMIESIRQPTSGNIKIFGSNVRTHFHIVKERIGILPQEFHSFELLTVRETLEYYAILFKKRANIDEILTAMDLKIHENKLYRNLSGGLKQRVGVAISLVNDPDIIFLDEPTTGLDPKARREVWDVIADLKNKGKTVFLTTHYMEEAEFLADHIAIIHKGVIIAEGTLDQLMKQYGKGNVLHLRNCSDSHVDELLRKNGFEAFKNGAGTVSVTLEYTEKLLEILSLLRHECIDFESIDIKRPNLEEIFLHLTGAKLKEAAT